MSVRSRARAGYETGWKAVAVVILVFAVLAPAAHSSAQRFPQATDHSASVLPGSIGMTCRFTQEPSGGVYSRWIRCNYGGPMRLGSGAGYSIPLCDNGSCSTVSNIRSKSSVCTLDAGGHYCEWSSSDTADSYRTGADLNLTIAQQLGTLGCVDVTACDFFVGNGATTPITLVSGGITSAPPAAFTEAELFCIDGLPCERDYSNQCNRLSITGPDPDDDWYPGETETWTFSWTSGNRPQALFFYWPGSVFDQNWTGADGYPRPDGRTSIELPQPVSGGTLTIPKYWLWHFELPNETDTPLPGLIVDPPFVVPIRQFDRMTRAIKAGELQIGCLFWPQSEDYLYSTIQWDGETEATTEGFRACDVVSFSRPVNWPEDGTDPIITLGNAQGNDPVGPIDVEWYDSATDTWVTVLDDQTIQPGMAGQRTFTVERGTEEFPYDLKFRCTDAQGTTEGGRWAGGPAYAIDDYEGPDPNCIETSGLGVAPSSWVPGLVALSACVARKAVVPQQSSIDLLTGAADAATARAPISYVVETVNLVRGSLSNLESSINAHDTDCLTIANTGSLGAGLIEMCPDDVPAGWTSARPYFGYIWWLIWGVGIIGVTRRILS